MHILLAILAAAAGVGILLWRLSAAAGAAREIVGAADDARGFFRRLAWSRKVNRSPLELVEDPREAAATMMVAVAAFDGSLTSAEEALILDQMHEVLDVSGAAGTELLQRARWIAKETGDLTTALKRLSRPIEAKVGAGERRQLIAMLTTVAAASGPANGAVLHSIAELERRLFAN